MDADDVRIPGLAFEMTGVSENASATGVQTQVGLSFHVFALHVPGRRNLQCTLIYLTESALFF